SPAFSGARATASRLPSTRSRTGACRARPGTAGNRDLPPRGRASRTSPSEPWLILLDRRLLEALQAHLAVYELDGDDRILGNPARGSAGNAENADARGFGRAAEERVHFLLAHAVPHLGEVFLVHLRACRQSERQHEHQGAEPHRATIIDP